MKLLLENWRRYLTENTKSLEKLKDVHDGLVDSVYRMKIIDDEFIHFTPLDRAIEILDDNMLKMNPPYQKFGINAVAAISTTYGTFNPGVQTTHIKTDEPIAAIKFKTSILPKQYRDESKPWHDQDDVAGPGHVEEVLWKTDVIFAKASLLDYDEAVALLEDAPIKLESNDVVYYY